MDYKTFIFIGCLIIGLINQGYANTIPSPSTEHDYLEDEYDYDDYADENRSKPDSNAISTNEATIYEDPPKFEKNSITIRAKTGDDVILPCDVINYRSTNVILWYNTSQLIVQGSNVLTSKSHIKLGENNSIKIKDATPHDSNVYSCQVLPNDIWLNITLIVTTEDSVKISVNDREDYKIPLTFRQGDNVTLECKYNGAESNTKIKWSLNGHSVHQHGAVTDNEIIRIKHVDARNAGNYQCLGDIPGKNSDLPVDSVHINVLYKPKTSTHRHHVNTKVGYHAELYCDYHANPIATVQWKRETDEITVDNEKYKIKNSMHNHRNRSILLVNEIDAKSDIGTYYCEAMNEYGSDYTKVYVILEPETPLYEKHEVEGRLVNLYWLTRSTTPLTEAILDYKLNRTTEWMTEAALSTHKHEDNQSNWKIHHKLEVPIGYWEARVRVRNQYGWSEYSRPFNFNINDEGTTTIKIDTTTEILAPLDIIKPAASEEPVIAKSGFGLSPSQQKDNSAVSNVVIMPLIVLVCAIVSIFNIVPSLTSNL